MINEKIIQALSELNISVLEEIKSKTDKYILFSIYNNRDTEFVENTNLCERYFISLKYYCLDYNDKKLYSEIKKLMKSNGFAFDDGGSLQKENDYYVQFLDFTIEIKI